MTEDTRTAGRALQITVPLLLPLLTPNARLHWRKKAEYVRQQRQVAYWSCGQQLIDDYVHFPSGLVRLDVEVHPLPRMQQHDDDNFWAAMKHYRDGIADSWLVVDDKQFRQGTLTWEGKCRSGEIIFTLSQEAPK